MSDLEPTSGRAPARIASPRRLLCSPRVGNRAGSFRRVGSSEVIGVFFGLTSILAYRCIVTRGPRAALVTVVLAMWAWLPPAVVAFTGCRYRYVTPWTETASAHALWIVLLLLPLLAIAALVSFGPRRDHVPDARVLR